MSSAEAELMSISPSGLVKMDEKKRPAAHNHDEHAHPRKKQVTSVNGGNKSDPDADMPWKDDLEVCISLGTTTLWRPGSTATS